MTNNPTHFENVIGRLKGLLRVNADKDLAERLSMSPNAFHNRKKSASLPYPQIINVSNEQKVNLNWLINGEGPIYKDKKPEIKEDDTRSNALPKENDITVIEHCDLVKNFIDQETAKEFNYYLVGIEIDDPEGYKSLFQEAKTTYKTIERMKEKFQPYSDHEDNQQKKTS